MSTDNVTPEAATAAPTPESATGAIANVQQPTAEASIIKRPVSDAPDFALLDANDASMGELASYMQPARIRVMQKNTKAPLSDRWRVGDVLLLPNEELITRFPTDTTTGNIKKDESPVFLFTPVMFFPRWATYNPMKIRPQHGTIRDQTYDPAHEIAVKSRKKDTRAEVCPDSPDGELMKHMEILCFVVMIHQQGISPVPALLEFKSGEYQAGSGFATLITARNAKPFACVFGGKCGFRKNESGEWFGIDVFNVNEERWIRDPAMFNDFKNLNEKLMDAHERRLIQIEPDDADVIEGETVNSF